METTNSLAFSDTISEKSYWIADLMKCMNSFFKERTYSKEVETYFMYIVCVGPEYEQFFKPTQPRYCKFRSRMKPKWQWREGEDNKDYIIKTFSIDIRIDYQSLVKSVNKLEVYTILAETFLDYLDKLVYPSSIRKSFDRDRFYIDMKEFFLSLGCKLDEELY